MRRKLIGLWVGVAGLLVNTAGIYASNTDAGKILHDKNCTRCHTTCAVFVM